MNRNKKQWLRSGVIASATAAVVGTTLAFTGPAGAWIEGPGNGGAPSTQGPDLQTVTLDPTNSLGDQMRASFCFDVAVKDSAIVAGNFYVKTYDAGRYLQGQAPATIDAASGGRCVVVNFTPNINLATQGSIGEVDQGAVETLGAAGVPNRYSSAKLTGSSLAPRAGQSTGPDLVGVVVDTIENRVTYEFDQELDPNLANIVQNGFHAVDDQGAIINSTAATLITDGTLKKVRAQFAPGDNVNTKIRFFNDGGAVRTLPQSGVTGGSAHATTAYTLATPGVISTGTGERPVLTGVTAAPAGQFDLTFSTTAALNPADVNKIIAVFDNGNVEAASARQNLSANQWRVSFPPAGDVNKEPSAVVKIVAQTGAVREINNNLPAPASEANLPAAPMRPGYTVSPDLLKVDFISASQAEFHFDEKIDPANLGAAGAFQLLVPNGSVIPGSSFGGTTEKSVVVSYSADLNAGVGVATGQGAVRDPLNNPMPYSSVSRTTTQPDNPGGKTAAECNAAKANAAAAATAATNAKSKLKKLKAKAKKAAGAKKAKLKKKIKKAKAAKKSTATAATAAQAATAGCP